MDAIIQNNLKLNELYQEILSSIQNEYEKSGALKLNHKTLFSQNLSYESRKILHMDGIKLSQMFKDFLNKIQLEVHYQLKNPLEKDPEYLIGLSRDELEALAESILSISKQEQLNDLLDRNSEAQLSA